MCLREGPNTYHHTATNTFCETLEMISTITIIGKNICRHFKIPVPRSSPEHFVSFFFLFSLKHLCLTGRRNQNKKKKISFLKNATLILYQIYKAGSMKHCQVSELTCRTLRPQVMFGTSGVCLYRLRQNTRVSAVGVRPAVTLDCFCTSGVCSYCLRQNTRLSAVGIRPAVTLDCVFAQVVCAIA